MLKSIMLKINNDKYTVKIWKKITQNYKIRDIFFDIFWFWQNPMLISKLV